jgi:L-lactate dehydrogenase complex protein LldG
MEGASLMNSSKEKILSRIREALRQPAARPGHHDIPSVATPTPHAKPELDQFRDWLPAVESDFQNQWNLLTQNFSALKTDYALLKNTDELKTFVRELAQKEQWKRMGIHWSNMTAHAANLPLEKVRVDFGYDSAELEKCDVGITECDAVVAQTGSILITSRSAGGRGLSVLPPHHLVLARTSQIVPDLPAAYELLYRRYGTDFPSMVSLITGPSRTGDIERIVVLGAHGPKKLTIALVQV